MDRIGRCMVDFAPHIAMMGANLSEFPSFINQTALSTMSMNGSI